MGLMSQIDHGAYVPVTLSPVSGFGRRMDTVRRESGRSGRGCGGSWHRAAISASCRLRPAGGATLMGGAPIRIGGYDDGQETHTRERPSKRPIGYW